MKRNKIFMLFIAGLATTLSITACRITVINDSQKPIVVMDGIQGDTDKLGIVNAYFANKIYHNRSLQATPLQPGASATIGNPHVHAHFLLGTKKPSPPFKPHPSLTKTPLQWYEVSQYQCTGRPHETLRAQQIIKNNFGNLSRNFGSKKL